MQAISSGINGLDLILDGGFARGATVIVEGQPGTGKTTLGMQFLYHGPDTDIIPRLFGPEEETIS